MFAHGQTQGDGKLTGALVHRYGQGAHRDPRDAAQVPPSVLKEHIGHPSIEHGDHNHGHSERHGSVSHQEAHRGI